MVTEKPVVQHDKYDDDAGKSLKLQTNARGFRYASTKWDRMRDAEYQKSFLDSEPTQLCFGNTPESLMRLRQKDQARELGGSYRMRP